jgi:hypothetical protein
LRGTGCQLSENIFKFPFTLDDYTTFILNLINYFILLLLPDSEKVSSGGLLSLWSGAKQKKESRPLPLESTPKKDIVVEEKGIYLDDLAHVEDPEIAKLYLGSPRSVKLLLKNL